MLHILNVVASNPKTLVLEICPVDKHISVYKFHSMSFTLLMNGHLRSSTHGELVNKLL